MNEEATPLFAGELAARLMKTSSMIDALVPSHYMLGLWIMLDGFGLTEVGLDWSGCQRLIVRIGLDGA